MRCSYEVMAELIRMQVPNIECNCLAFPNDGTAILSGWSDGKVCLHEPPTTPFHEPSTPRPPSRAGRAASCALVRRRHASHTFAHLLDHKLRSRARLLRPPVHPVPPAHPSTM